MVVGGSLVTSAVEPIWIAVAVGVLLLLAALVALELGLAAGSLTALAGAAASLELSRLGGTWQPSAYLPLVLLVVAFALAALSATSVRSALQAIQLVHGAGPATPANGSLGLLPASMAESRLDEEIERAAYAKSPLTVVWIRTRLFDVGMSQPDRGRVLRVASRTIESLLEVVHLPVAFSDADVVGILAETDELAAERLAERVRRSCASATLLVGAERTRRRFSELATVNVGIVAYPEAGSTAAALLHAAEAAVQVAGETSRSLPAPHLPAAPVGEPARRGGPGVPVMASAADRTLVSR